MTPAEACSLIEAFLAHNQIKHERLGDERLFAMVRGERKLTIPVAVATTADAVLFESFFMRRPMENQAAFYELLMRRNMRAPGVVFALDHEGDVYLVGRIPLSALSEDELDRLFGALLTEADGMFMPAIEIGFASYLAADMNWRAKAASATTPGTA